jgi:hypothetical protein
LQQATAPVASQTPRAKGGFGRFLIVVVLGTYGVRVRQVQVKKRRRARRREMVARRAA